jgi:hypothetical protein
MALQLSSVMGSSTAGVSLLSGSTTDNAIVRWDGATGNLIQNSGCTIDDSDNMIVAGNLTVSGTTTTINSTTVTVADKNILINEGGTTAGTTGAGIDIEGDAAAVVGYFRVGSADNTNLEFKAPGNAGVFTVDINGSQTLYMNATGFGIGETSPSKKLHISQATAGEAELIYLQNTQAANTANTVRTTFRLETDAQTRSSASVISGFSTITDATRIGTYDIKVADGSDFSERLSIRGSNVGIGTITPSTFLNLYENTTSTTPQFSVEQDGTGDAAINFLLTAGQNWTMGIDNSDADKFKISEGATVEDTTRLTIDSSGNVGISTDAPTNKLHVNLGAANNTQGVILDSSGSEASLQLRNSSAAGKEWQILSTGTGAGAGTGKLQFYNTTDAVTGLIIQSDGTVGIGINTPATDLHVKSAGGAITVDTDSAGNSSSLYFAEAGTNKWRLFNDGGTDAFIISDADASATRLTIDNTGVVIPSVGIKLDNLGSADVNVLDDYEEGTWTPTVDSGVTSPTYASQFGHYTKVGNTVYVTMFIETTGGTLNGSQLKFGGLPFTASGDNQGEGMTLVQSNDVGLVNSCVPSFTIPNSSDQIFGYVPGTGALYVGTDLTNNTWSMRAFGFYRV